MEGPMNENSFNQHSPPETLGTDETLMKLLLTHQFTTRITKRYITQVPTEDTHLPALLVVSATNDSTEVSNAALIPFWCWGCDGIWNPKKWSQTKITSKLLLSGLK